MAQLRVLEDLGKQTLENREVSARHSFLLISYATGEQSVSWKDLLPAPMRQWQIQWVGLHRPIR